ncbi:TPA: hypothetical protein HA238_03260 [Candidatus Micrarchaeota archaeon]|nr:hypothetical protein [Candidatus Micrarchaeota archaeon]
MSSHIRLFLVGVLLLFLISSSFAPLFLKAGEEFTKYGYRLKLDGVFTGDPKPLARFELYDATGAYLGTFQSQAGLFYYPISDSKYLSVSLESVQSFGENILVDLNVILLNQNSFSKVMYENDIINLGLYEVRLNEFHKFDDTDGSKVDYVVLRVRRVSGSESFVKLLKGSSALYYDEATGDSITFLLSAITKQQATISYSMTSAKLTSGERFYSGQLRSYGSLKIALQDVNSSNRDAVLFAYRKDSKNTLKKATVFYGTKNAIELPNKDIVQVDFVRFGSFPRPDSSDSIMSFADTTIKIVPYEKKANAVRLKEGESATIFGIPITLSSISLLSDPLKAYVVLKLDSGDVLLDISVGKNVTYSDAASERKISLYLDRVDSVSDKMSMDIVVDVVKPASSTLPLGIYSGWNLLFVPYSNPQITGCSFEASKSFAYANNAYAKLATLQPFTGFWYKAPYNCAAVISGDLKKGHKITLSKGWNIFGTFSQKSASSLSESCIVEKGPYLFDGSAKQYALSSSFSPGRGYVAKVASDCTFAID